MDKIIIKKYIKKGLSQRAIGRELGVSQTTVKYWMNIYELKTRHQNLRKGLYLCLCGETRSNEFYGHRKNKCKACFNKEVIERGKRNKLYGIALLGGKCKLCGYDKSKNALQFHHTNPSTKDINFNSKSGWSKQRLKKELNKCILLCANCHAEEHERLNNVG